MKSLHRRTHPVNVDGCYACRLSTLHVAPSAMGSQAAIKVVKKDKQWDVDMAAYKRLRDSGVQPRSIDGSATIEKTATEDMEIKLGRTFDTPNKAAMFRDANEISQELGFTA